MFSTFTYYLIILSSFILFSCTSSTFSGSPNSARKVNTAGATPKVTPTVTPVVTPIVTPTPTPIITNTGPTTIDDLVITAQEGRSVEACFAYDADKMSALVDSGEAWRGHHCNRAEFYVTLSGTQVGTINLNNNSEGDMPGPGQRTEGPSVFGGKYSGKWINGKFDVQISCALDDCHEDVTFLSIIGEVITTSGKIMWLKIDQGVIYPGEKYEYVFSEFSLSDVKPSFGTYCELQ